MSLKERIEQVKKDCERIKKDISSMRDSEPENHCASCFSVVRARHVALCVMSSFRPPFISAHRRALCIRFSCHSFCALCVYKRVQWRPSLGLACLSVFFFLLVRFRFSRSPSHRFVHSRSSSERVISIKLFFIQRTFSVVPSSPYFHSLTLPVCLRIFCALLCPRSYQSPTRRRPRAASRCVARSRVTLARSMPCTGRRTRSTSCRRRRTAS